MTHILLLGEINASKNMHMYWIQSNLVIKILYPLISGSRGVGKTVLLHQYEALLKQRKFFVFSDVLGPSTYSDLMRVLSGKQSAATKKIHKEFAPSISVVNGDTSYTIGGFTFSTEKEIEFFDMNLGETLRKKVSQRTYDGVAIILDELNMKYIDDLRRLIVTIQAATNKDSNIIMIAAGVDENIDNLEDDVTVSFTRRMNRINIGNLEIEAVKSGISRTLHDHDMQITNEGTRHNRLVIRRLSVHRSANRI